MLIMIFLLLLQIISAPSSAQEIIGTSMFVLEQVDRNIYVLGPGDVVTVVIEGGCTEVLLGAGVLPWMSCRIGSDGYLSVSGIGAVAVDGLTIDEAQHVLQRSVSNFYPLLNVTLSLSEPRMLRASVRGMVNEPGTYIMTSLDRVSLLVREAGGISAYGSRTGNMFTANGDTLEVNLHIDQLTGSPISDPFLSNGASVLFEACENPVYLLRTSMVYPAAEIDVPEKVSSVETWELGSYDNFEALVSRMGGLPGNVDLSRTRIVRNNAHFPVWADTVGFINQLILPGDTILIVMYSDSIPVGGAVMLPGMVTYRPESTVHQYILAAGGPEDTANLGGAVLLRNGIEMGSGSNILEVKPLPGDAIEVPYNWISQNKDAIIIVSTVFTIWYTLDRILDK